MKNISLIFIQLVCISLIHSQDVIVSLTGRHFQTPVELDSIRLENLTNGSRTLFSVLPEGVTTYRINLSAGSILGIDPGTQSGFPIVEALVNRPGSLKLALTLRRPESVEVCIISQRGEILLNKALCVSPHLNILEVSSGVSQVLLVEVSGGSFRHVEKMAGSGTGERTRILLSPRDGQLKSGYPLPASPSILTSGFVFTPGDTVRFTIYKTAYFPSESVQGPQHDDSYLLFLSRPCPSGSTLTDVDGNVYHTVQIGDQCWMRQNLNTTRYADGTPLVDGTGVGPVYGDYTTPYWFNYDDSLNNSITYGKLYTWAAVMHGSESSNSNPSGVQGICPAGWHVPSDAEWMELEMFLGMSAGEANRVMEWRGTDEGGKLKETGTTRWQEPNTGATNESGFTALPAGQRNDEGLFLGKQYAGFYHTSTEYQGTSSSASRFLSWDMSMIWRDFGPKNFAFSIRCLKD
ncbi:MAG: fibrobacter succinogenes major paralogous domain-containing protein [Bacteroidota bacterium]